MELNIQRLYQENCLHEKEGRSQGKLGEPSDQDVRHRYLIKIYRRN